MEHLNQLLIKLQDNQLGIKYTEECLQALVTDMIAKLDQFDSSSLESETLIESLLEPTGESLIKFLLDTDDIQDYVENLTMDLDDDDS